MRRTRLAAALTAVVSVCGLLTGCGSPDDGRDTVTMWTYPIITDPTADREFWTRTVAGFRERHPEIRVEVVSQPWSNRDATLTTALLAGKGPDVGYLIPDQVGRYHAQDVLAPIEDFLPEETMADYRDNALAALSIDEIPYVAPILMSALVGSCDQRVLDATGVEPPSTWAELLEIAPVLREQGYYATHYQGDLQAALNMNFYQYLWQAGGTVFTDDGDRLAVDGPEGVAALEFLTTLVDEEYVDRSALTQAYQPDQSPMARGRVACVYNMGPTEAAAAMGGSEHLRITPPLTGAVQTAYGTVGGYAVFHEARDPDAVRAWMAYLTSTEVMSDYNRAAGYFSPRESVTDLYPDDPVLAEAEQYLELTTPGEPHSRYREVLQIVAPLVQSALLGEQSPQDALTEAARVAEPLLAS
ncbi:multiple sugar transport system substrate-binding protein [Actinoalloteichus hoggarensis]|uniref:Bacterial extracellular solute-binding protein n=1 Tax=Actinoalloteichus hoggarensis TaxID=1470176 RepID=A0A221W5J7_9PSEU|nr:extracellular solute-binding protein [Actinoalloteichus hoggarensis]ASO20971.1 Bacterial extracellular solute-binding protein [Actinoalloteichus hoggarensis]MBB5920902.1 multiple sugar transport system substrate-binding protein [Actinoalloteichus hoggarensis]